LFTKEDELGDFELGAARFSGVHACKRCQVVLIDQATGISSKEPLKTLSKYRLSSDSNHVLFGMNVRCTQAGLIKVGDTIQ
jgi:uncharacterized protein YcbX